MKLGLVACFVISSCGVEPSAYDTVPSNSSELNLAENTEGFVDTDGHRWEQEILEANSRNIVKGYPDGHYLPDASVTREEQVAIMVSALKAVRGLEAFIPESVTEAPFPDVPASRWSAAFISYALDNRLVSGYPDGLFRPEAQVTRGEVASMISGLMSLISIMQQTGPWVPPIEAESFADSESHWAAGDIQFLSASCKAASAYEEDGDSFRPDTPSKRGYSAAVVMIAMRCYGI